MPKNTNPNAIARNLRVSRDAIFASADPGLRNKRVVLDGAGANLELLSFQRNLGTGFAIGRGPTEDGRRIGQLYLVVQTGEARLGNWRVRVAVYPAHDDGTDKLSFATDRIGGVVNTGVAPAPASW